MYGIHRARLALVREAGGSLRHAGRTGWLNWRKTLSQEIMWRETEKNTRYGTLTLHTFAHTCIHINICTHMNMYTRIHHTHTHECSLPCLSALWLGQVASPYCISVSSPVIGRYPLPLPLEFDKYLKSPLGLAGGNLGSDQSLIH